MRVRIAILDTPSRIILIIIITKPECVLLCSHFACMCVISIFLICVFDARLLWPQCDREEMTNLNIKPNAITAMRNSRSTLTLHTRWVYSETKKGWWSWIVNVQISAWIQNKCKQCTFPSTGLWCIIQSGQFRCVWRLYDVIISMLDKRWAHFFWLMWMFNKSKWYYGNICICPI